MNYLYSSIKTYLLKKGWVQSLFIAYFFIFTLCLLVYAIEKPIQNWDLIAYVGSVKSFQTTDKSLIHESTFTALKDYMDDENYQLLTNSSEYRKRLYTDSESFNQILPWYAIRFVYTGLMYLLSKLGINIFTAGHLISAVSLVIGLWVYYFAFRRYIAGTLWFAVPLFVLMNGNVESARLATPDSLAFLYTGILTYIFLHRRDHLFWLLPLAILIRTDLIFLVALMLGYLFLRHKKLRIFSVVSFVVAILIYLQVNSVFGNYGWATVFYLVFVSDFTLNYPATTEVTVTITDYFSAILKGGYNILITDAFDVFIGIFALHLGISLRLNGVRESFRHFFSHRVNALTVIAFIYVIIHFLVFPAGYSRFFGGQYLVVLLAFLALLSRINGISPNHNRPYRKEEYF